MALLVDQFKVNSPNVEYTEDHIVSKYAYQTNEITRPSPGETSWTLTPTSKDYEFRVERKVPKLGVMLVGWGGNNGTTVTGGVIANRENMTWRTKKGEMKPNYWGSLTQASTVRVGNVGGQEVYTPFKALLPLVEPNDIVLGGWDISSMNLADAMSRAGVLDIDLQQQLRKHLEHMVPLPAPYDPSFIAANQSERADNVLTGTKQEQMEKIREHIRSFKTANQVDKVVVLWTANTERFATEEPGVNDTAENLLASLKDEARATEISPSQLFAIACILEKTPFVNGAPQNTFVKGVVELAVQHKSLIGGDDFKSGQTKMKSVLVDFLIGSGIKPVSIVSYNHLGNNDGCNLSAPQTFRSKEVSKSNVVDDMVESNELLYKDGKRPDHAIVIKYIPYVGDSKRAMDEYTSEIFMGGQNTIVMHNTCEDSLLAAPIILDLVLIAELITRIEFKKDGETDFSHMHPVAVLLSFLTKAPLVPEGTPCINALSKQRAMVENILKACVGLPPDNNMLLEFK